MTRRDAVKLTLAGAAAARSAFSFDNAYSPDASNLKAREWFQDAKFGLFIHWGVYSVLGRGEWVMNQEKIPIVEYEKLAPKFNPIKFDAAQWVAMAKAAGQRYITITSKHHDGFATFATKQNKWNIVDATPYAKDVLKPLSEECRKQGLKLFFYHSHLDWHSPDYFPRGETGKTAGRPESGDFNRYLDFMDAQLSELLTGYGEVAGIWFDGIWDKRGADWRLRRTYDLIHRHQPQALVGNNHHLAPFEGEDFQMFEKDLPGENKTGFSGDAKVGRLPLETCETINGAWGYNAGDKNLKSTKALLHYLVNSAGRNANFLLNIGPKPDGTVQDDFVTRLKEMGEWLAKNGESIYGTRGGPISPRPWGVTTKKGSTVYAHVLNWPDPVLPIPRMEKAVKSAKMLASGQKVVVKNWGDQLLLGLPEKGRDEIDTVIALETA